MLKIVVHNSDASRPKAISQESRTKSTIQKLPSLESFLFGFQETSDNLYDFHAKDFDHELSCKITLERKEIFAYSGHEDKNLDLVPAIACDFPPIDNHKGQEKVFGNAYLRAMTVIQFQLKVLEQLLLFCEDKEAAYLILSFNESNFDNIEIYQRFVVSQEEFITERGKQTELLILTNIKIYDEVTDFMDKVDKQFHQVLWREQRFNQAFRSYLKNHCL
jgi:hypothetical protein